MLSEKRNFRRLEKTAIAVVSHPSFGRESFDIKDISDGGIALKLSGKNFPPKNTIVEVKIKQQPSVSFNAKRMRVVHLSIDSVGLQFVD